VTTRRVVHLHLPSRESLRRVDHLPHRKPAIVSQIEDVAFTASLEVAQSEHMRASQIDDVDVVPNTSAVRCRVVRSEDVDGLAQSGGCLQDQGNQVRFGLMPLSDLSIRVRPRRIEIAKGHKFQTKNFMVPLQNFFEYQFGFAVRINWPLGIE